MSGTASAQGLVSAKAFATTNTLADEEAAAATAMEEGAIRRGASYSMANIATVQKYDQVKITFVEYLDVIDDGWHARMRVSLSGDANAVTNELEESPRKHKSTARAVPTGQISGDGDEGETTLTITIDRLGVARLTRTRKRNNEKQPGRIYAC